MTICCLLSRVVVVGGMVVGGTVVGGTVVGGTVVGGTVVGGTVVGGTVDGDVVGGTVVGATVVGGTVVGGTVVGGTGGVGDAWLAPPLLSLRSLEPTSSPPIRIRPGVQTRGRHLRPNVLPFRYFLMACGPQLRAVWPR